MVRVSCSLRARDPSGQCVYQLWTILSGLFKPRYWILAFGHWFLGILVVAKESKVKFCFNACLLACYQQPWYRSRAMTAGGPDSDAPPLPIPPPPVLLHIWHALSQALHLGCLGLADPSLFSDFSIHPLTSMNLTILGPHHLRPAGLGSRFKWPCVYNHLLYLILMVKANNHECFCFVFGNVGN